MIAFGAPYWLLGLAVIPAIWWLHRASGHGPAVLVPSLDLFRDAATPGQGGERAQSMDPAWRRRALAAALLALALAQPAIERPARDVIVWLDDSPSMAMRESAGRAGIARIAPAERVGIAREAPAVQPAAGTAQPGAAEHREAGVTRLALAFDAVRAALRERAAGRVADRVEIRSLAYPGRVYALDATQAAATAGTPAVAITDATADATAAATPAAAVATAVALTDATAAATATSEPRPPPPQSLRRDAAHWLVTDGTSPTLTAWAREAPLERTIVVGTRTENAGIVALAARTSLADPARLDVQVQVANAGRAPARRELVVRAGDTEILRQPLELAAGANETVSLSAARPAASPPATHPAASSSAARPAASSSATRLAASPPAARPAARAVSALTATLEPADDLADDDTASLPAAALRRLRVAVAASCATALHTAVATHPEIEVVPADREGNGGDDGIDVDVQCGRDAAPRGHRTLLVHDGGGSSNVGGAAASGADGANSTSAAAPATTAGGTITARDAAWSAVARRAIASDSLPRVLVAFGSTSRDAAGTDAARTGVEPLLTSAAGTLVSRRTGSSGPTLIDTTLALGDDSLAHAAEYPLLIGALLDLAAGEPLLGRTIRTARDPASLVVAALPATIDATTTAGTTAASTTPTTTAATSGGSSVPAGADPASSATRAPVRPATHAHVATWPLTPLLALLATLAVLWDLAATARRTRLIADAEALT